MVSVRARPSHTAYQMTTGIARIAPNCLATAAVTTCAPVPVTTTLGMTPLQLGAISLPIAIAHEKAATPLPSAIAPGRAAIPLPLATAPGRAAILEVGGATIARALLTACNKST